jgi:hypothetical protein
VSNYYVLYVHLFVHWFVLINHILISVCMNLTYYSFLVAICCTYYIVSHIYVHVVLKVTQNLAVWANFMMEFQVMHIVVISIQSVVKLQSVE